MWRMSPHVVTAWYASAFIRTLEGCGPLAMVARSPKFIPCPDYLDLNSSGQG